MLPAAKKQKKREEQKMAGKRKKAAGIIGLALLCSISIVKGVQAEETYVYDKLNRLKKVTYDTGDVLTYQYDANGNIKSVERTKEDSNGGNSLNPDAPNQGENQGNTGNTENEGNGQNKEENSNPNGGNTSQETPGTETPPKNNNGSEAPPRENLSKKTVKKKTADYTIFFIGNKVSDVQLTTYKDKKAQTFTMPDTITYKGKKYKVTAIGEKAFCKKTKLQKITIGTYVKTIGKKAFYGDKKLVSITVKATKLTKVGSDALKGTNTKLKINVPSKKVTSYRKLFKNKGNKNVKITK